MPIKYGKQGLAEEIEGKNVSKRKCVRVEKICEGENVRLQEHDAMCIYYFPMTKKGY